MSKPPKYYISDIPELMKEWDWEKNNKLGLDPSKIATGDSRTKVWWRCEYGHEWKTTPNSRKGGSRCPKCVDESRTSFPEQAIFFYLQQVTIAYNRYQIRSGMEIDVYLPELKIGIEYDGFYYHTKQRTIQKEQQKDQYCLQSGITLIRIKEVKDSKIIKREQNIIYCHHRHPGSSLTETINTLLKYIELLTTQSFNINVDIEKDRSIIHNQYIYIEKHNSIQYTHPEICKYWNYDKNGRLQPNLFSYGSNKKVWWKCPICGYEWQAKINNKIRSNPCSQCTPKKAPKITYNKPQRLKKFSNSLASKCPHLILEFDQVKNGLFTPDQISYGNNRKFWWKCSVCGHEWEASPHSRSSGTGCPVCSRQKQGIPRKTHEQFEKEVSNKNNTVKILGEYISSANKIDCQCLICGHTWSVLPASLLYSINESHNGCPLCAKQKFIEGGKKTRFIKGQIPHNKTQ